MDPTQPITQKDLASALGIAPTELKKLRDEHLQPHTDFTPGQPIVYAPSGIKKIRAALDLPEPVASADADTPPVPSPSEKNRATARVALAVIRPARGNTRIVLCQTQDERRPVNLRVKNNANFTPGMIVPTCVQSPLSAELYDYEGRLPRWKGRF